MSEGPHLTSLPVFSLPPLGRTKTYQYKEESIPKSLFLTEVDSDLIPLYQASAVVQNSGPWTQLDRSKIQYVYLIFLFMCTYYHLLLSPSQLGTREPALICCLIHM